MAVFNNSIPIITEINKIITAQSNADICLCNTAAIIRTTIATIKCTTKDVSSFKE
jgi:hypothetical protein